MSSLLSTSSHFISYIKRQRLNDFFQRETGLQVAISQLKHRRHSSPGPQSDTTQELQWHDANEAGAQRAKTSRKEMICYYLSDFPVSLSIRSVTQPHPINSVKGIMFLHNVLNVPYKDTYDHKILTQRKIMATMQQKSPNWI